MSFELLAASATLLLLAFGGFWFWRRRRKGTAPVQIPIKKEEPSAAIEPPPSLPPVVQIVVMARRGEMEGAQLGELFYALGLKRERDGIFYRRAGGYWFGIANADPEGAFPNELPPFTTRGVVLFCYPAELEDPAKAFSEMVEAARRIKSAFDAIWLNEALEPLTEEALEALQRKLEKAPSPILSVDQELEPKSSLPGKDPAEDPGKPHP